VAQKLSRAVTAILWKPWHSDWAVICVCCGCSLRLRFYCPSVSCKAHG